METLRNRASAQCAENREQVFGPGGVECQVCPWVADPQAGDEGPVMQLMRHWVRDHGERIEVVDVAS